MSSAGELSWTIYYKAGDGIDSISNLDCKVENLPGGDVLAICQVDDLVGYEILTGAQAYGKDFFWFDFQSSSWFVGDVFGLSQYIMEPGLQKILLGRAVSRKDWNRMQEQIIEHWGKKFSFHHGERRN